ncbi:hypothetical protein [Streptomyces pseudovenezuelae]|uniref:hypothetical protein n=1 Tax=Streptomyces pseudovenezuelae TaxID=67350 RepID=UPI002E823396|nr:hypothetical protein [Streptomyces pseudovenezuelae]WUA87595.1 hypothetical protein OHO81_09990 [Streptomyces pseudovenezuelae]
MHDSTPDTDLGSFAAVLASELRGAWTSTYHAAGGGSHDDALTDQVWDMNDIADALAKCSVDHYAVLTRDDGTRLFVADPLEHGGGYLVATVAPTDAPDEAFRGVREPDGITVDADPFSAAEDIHYDLLPRYDKALVQVRTNAARLTTSPAAKPDHLVMTWSGDALVVDKPDRDDIVQALTHYGFAFDPERDVFALSGDDSARQAASVRAVGHHLSELGVGIVLRNPPGRPALGTTAMVPPGPPVTGPHRSR